MEPWEIEHLTNGLRECLQAKNWIRFDFITATYKCRIYKMSSNDGAKFHGHV